MVHPQILRSKAFTLVELLVVMGIIAILVGILLPVTSRAMDSARSAACKSNLRSIYQATAVYAADNRGYLPYGFYWSQTNWATGDPNSLSNLSWVSWYTAINKTLNPKAPNIDVTNGNPKGGASKVMYELSKVFRCPAADGQFVQQVHYYQHGVAMPHLPMELKNSASRPGPNNSAIKTPIDRPARFTDLYNDNILFWDTPLMNDPTVDSKTALPFFRPDQGEAGTANNVLPLTHIDGLQLRNPAITEFRFRDHVNRFAAVPATELRALDQTIYFPTDELVYSQTGGKLPSFNVDQGGTVMSKQLVGNVRFRHARQTECNVAMADGSVQSARLNKNRKIVGSGGSETYETTIQRKQIMIKWPTGVAPSGTYSAD
jgi:prepilin-type N-terminal cleavage/methylation domain-containing protein/prepilin-type processing-associated H-X9-DG protein